MTPSSPSPDRAALIERIRKLAKFTIAAGCSEHEAAAAAAKVAELISAHNVQQSELSIRADARGCITDDFTEITKNRPDWADCIMPIAALYSCRTWYKHDYDDPLGLGLPQYTTKFMFFGFPADVAACIATCALIYNAVSGEAAKFRGDKLSFRAGMIARLRARLEDMERTVHRAAAPSGSTALISLKHQLVTEEYAKLNLRLRATRPTASRAADSRAYAAGAAAGSRTDLGGSKVTARGDGAMPRIGKI